jgi:nucleotide sugar dehydrogenase
MIEENGFVNISVFGLGKVGLTLAACLAASGHRVIGVDVDRSRIVSVNNKTIKCDEEKVLIRIKDSKDRLFATDDSLKAVLETDLSVIIVPTPSNVLGGFSLKYILEACEAIGKGLREKRTPHVVSVMSTVFPQSGNQFIVPKLESISGKKIGDELGYCYNPSFISLGNVVNGIERPDYMLLGETNSWSGDLVKKVHLAMIPKTTPIMRMSLVGAEITKLASNAHDTMRASFANMLMEVCSETPGANVDHITQAMSHHVGMRFFKGAVPFGGPCWPRDNKALSLFLETIGISSNMSRSVDHFNDEHGKYILRKILEVSPADSKIGIIGLAYKSGTSFIERSYGVDLVLWLLAEKRSVILWDPLALNEVRAVLGDQVIYACTINECVQEASTVVIVNDLKEVAGIDWSSGGQKTVVDCWRCLEVSQQKLIGRYIPLGFGVDRFNDLCISSTLVS